MLVYCFETNKCRTWRFQNLQENFTEVNIMEWKDYETIVTKKELEKLRIQYENEKRKREPVNKGERADIFKKRYS